MRIHIIEDDQTLVTILTRFSEMSGGTEITSSSSAEQALETQAQQQQFDVIISDVFLPDMAGLKYFEKLRESSRGAKLIMISGRCTPEQTRIISDQADAFLTKPFSIEEFQEAVQDSIK